MADPVESPPEPSQDSPDSEARQWGMFAHLSCLLGLVIPFGNVIGPLIIWQMKKEVPFVADQGIEALNFQITVAIAAMISFVLSFILIGFFLLAALAIATLVLTIIAAIRANEGTRYRYPFAFRFIS